MAGRITLSRAAVKLIGQSVDQLFHRVAARYLGPDYLKKWGNKTIAVDYRPGLTLQELYSSAAGEERSRPDTEVMDHLARIANGYLDATREQTKARVVAHVDRFMRDAEEEGTETDLETVLGGHLYEVFGKARADVVRILDSENTHARNLGSLEGITKVSAAMGVEDPTVFFIVVNDEHLCDECRRLHLLEDNITPRVWKLSEVGSGYHKRGDPNPKIGSLHPHDRCSLAQVATGYGFRGGGIAFIAIGHDEFARQRGEDPA